MKTIYVALLGILFTTASCVDTVNTNVPFENNQLITQIDAIPMESLNDGEKEAIVFMREEEKLARDVYDNLFVKWRSNSFNNIATSEQSHMDAVFALINKYGLEDPAINDIPGKFVNPKLQSLYNELIETGSLSLEDAFKVGAAIEEIDILDLIRALETDVDNEDILLVFDNLLKGSRNHLRSFVLSLSKLGITYTPQYMPLDDYNEIINSDMERGSGLSKN